MASAFDVKSNCSRSSVGTQSLNNLPAQFPSTSFTVFVIGSALDFGAFLSGTRARLVCGGVMHQSIPNAPCTPPGNCGAFARLVSPGGGVFANLARPGGRAFANPGDNPEKFVDDFKGMFS